MMAPYHGHYVKVGGALIALVIVGGYVAFQARGIIAGPQILVTSPENGATLSQSLVTIRGTASAITHLTLNDRPIHTDTEGNFEEELLLAPGYNVLSVEAKDRFGRETTQVLELIHK